MFQKSETLYWVKLQLCGFHLGSLTFPPKQSTNIHHQAQFPTTYKFNVASSLVQCKLPTYAHIKSLQVTHNTQQSALIWLLITSHSSWHCLLAVFSISPTILKTTKETNSSFLDAERNLTLYTFFYTPLFCTLPLLFRRFRVSFTSATGTSTQFLVDPGETSIKVDPGESSIKVLHQPYSVTSSTRGSCRAQAILAPSFCDSPQGGQD